MNVFPIDKHTPEAHITTIMRKTYPTLGAYLKARNIPQYRLAAELGISGIFLSEIRRGKRTPRLELAIRIAGYCRVPIESLVGRIEEPAA